MSWEDLYPVVAEQAHWAVLRYDPRRKDKIQELTCQAYEKFTRDKEANRPITIQSYKYFVERRAKEVDRRSFCKKGYGGTSMLDALSFYRRRPDVDTEIVSFDEWMTTKPRSKEATETLFSFNVDFKEWQKTLTPQLRSILTHLMQGYKADQIASILMLSYTKVRQAIKELKANFLDYFRTEEVFAY